MQHLQLHEWRMLNSRKELWGITSPIPLGDIVIPNECRMGKFKCRLVYKEKIESIEFLPYGLRKIKTLKVVTADHIEYAYKFLDRTPFMDLFLQHNEYDELVLVKNGLITDSSFSNLAFFDGSHWFTPATPLLMGTRREALLNQEMILETDIRPENLGDYQIVSFINAMLGLGELTFPVSALDGRP